MTGTATEPALICLTPAALALGRRLQAAIGGRVHATARAGAGDIVIAETIPHLQQLFRAGTPIVGLCAAGILVRAVAPVLADKQAEPPVVAVAEDGSAVVPLLGGHRGANALARALGAVLAIVPAITTAGELRLGFALDAPPPGWRLSQPEQAKPLMAALLAGTPVALAAEVAVDWPDPAAFTPGAALSVPVTWRAVDGFALHPPVLAVGVGCERGADPAELTALVDGVLAEHGLAPGAVALVGSIDLKADEPAVHAVAERLGAPARFFPAARLAEEAPRLATPSETVLRETGCPGVAEGAALAAVGPGGRLLVPKRRGRRTTVAVAVAAQPIEAATLGRPQGRLDVVGIGPGDAGSRTADAVTALTAATRMVGYGLYLDLVADLIGATPRVATALGQETERVDAALALAAAGERVALVCSGDPGVYALATLVMERLAGTADPAWRRVAVGIVPGISAMQAAAARLGAPLGHDFAAISLSDLLTPWPAIERRLAAAADGDFVVALYNPRSERRGWQLGRALTILGARRPADTPVALGRNLGRADETVEIATLASLDPTQVDMLTLVLIGSSTTRAFAHGGRTRLYTPRGYAAKASAPS